jgi:hypothetical protein
MTVLDDLRARAQRKLDQQAGRVRRYQQFYDGEAAVMALLGTEERQTFLKFLRESHANWSELVVNAVAERLTVTGFRFGADSEQAWLLWQANQMDADAELVQTEALVTGQCPVLVQPDEDNPSGVSITAESPLEACVLYEPGNRRRRTAGFKRFTDDTGEQYLTDVLLLPDVIATWLPNAGQPVIEQNPSGVVGMVEITPQPRLGGPGRSELDPVIPIQDRINTTIFNRLVATDYGAFRQIWATGVKMAREVIQTDDGGETTRTVRPYDVGANRLLVNERPEGRFGSFPESSLSGYLSSVEQDVTMLAAITQTPAHYLLGQMVNLSADAIRAAEAGLVAKVSRRALHIGEDWETVMRIALGLVGSAAATNLEAEVIWGDWETRSEGQRVDALVKMGSLGVPRQVLWERWGATQQEIDRWRELPTGEPAPQPQG